MALREKFGRLVLLEETDSGQLGNEYRAARLGPSGFDRLVTVLRFSPTVSAHAEASKRLVEEARLAAQIHNSGIVRVLGVGRVGPSFYVSTELVEGRSLRTVLNCCREEGFPFGADHGLMITSRAAAGLELLHSRKDEAGRPLFHGLVSPRHLVVAFDGEVKLKGLGLWSALGSTELLASEERGYLAPEQAEQRGDARSDIYALGLVLLEALSGQPTDASDPLERVAKARLASPGGEGSPLPRPLGELLRRALAPDPAARFVSMVELRKAIDALLFSGDFTPTTFDLAFFMHTLFRDEVERDARAFDDARAGDYREFMAEEAAKGPAALPARTEPYDAGTPQAPATDALAALPTEVPAPTLPEPKHSSQPLPAPVPLPTPVPRPASGPGSDASLRTTRVAREAGARDAVARLSLGGGASAPRASVSRRYGLAIGLFAAIVVGGGAGWLYYYVTGRRAAVATAQSAEQAAAQARVRELEAKIAQLEQEKAAAETRAAEEAKIRVEKQAAAGGRPVDPAAIEREQQEARRRAREEQERKQQEELQRLAQEKRAEELRLATAAAAAAAAAATPLPTPVPALVLSPTPLAQVSPATAAGTGAASAASAEVPQLVAPAGPTPTPTPPTPAPAAAVATASPASRPAPADPADPAVRPPALISEDPVPYPRRAMSARLAAVVVVRALVEETGRVVEATVTQPSGQPAAYGFDEAALKRVRSRKYRPARRNNVPVPIWVVIRVEFRPPPPTR